MSENKDVQEVDEPTTTKEKRDSDDGVKKSTKLDWEYNIESEYVYIDPKVEVRTETYKN
jgi:hypothetical protein